MENLIQLIKKHSNNVPLALELLNQLNDSLYTDKEKECDLLQHIAISATMAGHTLVQVSGINSRFKAELQKASMKALDSVGTEGLECTYTYTEY